MPIFKRLKAEDRKPTHIFGARSAWTSKKLWWLDTFSYTCSLCGDFGTTIDRIVPGAAGGGYCDENVTVLCIQCNQLKSDHISVYTLPSIAHERNYPRKTRWAIVDFVTQFQARYQSYVIQSASVGEDSEGIISGGEVGFVLPSRSSQQGKSMLALDKYHQGRLRNRERFSVSGFTELEKPSSNNTRAKRILEWQENLIRIYPQT